jgi:hypothetical protein
MARFSVFKVYSRDARTVGRVLGNVLNHGQEHGRGNHE